MKAKTSKHVSAIGVSAVILTLLSLIAYTQYELAQRDHQIQQLQEQIEELESLLGLTRKGTWNLVTSFGGSSDLTTDYFFVAGTDLRMNWTCFSSNESAIFAFYVYREGHSESVGAFTDLQDRGTTFLRDVEQANYYIHITIDQVDQWSMTIETWIPS
jgi:hypothetical protein